MERGSSGHRSEDAQQGSDVGVTSSMDEPMPLVGNDVFGVGTVNRVHRAPDSLIVDAFERHQAELHGFALQMSRDPDVAADLVQEAFLRLIRETNAGRGPDNVRAWLYRVVANLATSRGRRASVAARWQGFLVQRDVVEGPERAYLDAEASGEVHALLADLSSDERAALLLSAHGFTGAEIAVALGRTHLATRALLYRARSRLRDAARTREDA